ncbi:hypothetical protein Cni_G07155 [Canna indica]|uniref:Epidermal patterning factor-like protein n=1 Tax=Canna indica TaxID=4628 RepID=A0AAQ3JZV7_9LILI|nr:hypothetical protein Cni_G07155 [Canna indica]
MANPHLFLSFLLLFCSVHCLPLTEGRPLISKLEEVAKEREETPTVEVTMIGSRPPRCEGRCLSCGQCEAVQVPAVPQEKSGASHYFSASRGDDSSSIYKPLSWKCKCGGVILNP